MTDSRPGNKTPDVKFSVESDFQIKNQQLLRLEGKNKEKRNSKNSFFLSVIFFFLFFFKSVRRVNEVGFLGWSRFFGRTSPPEPPEIGQPSFVQIRLHDTELHPKKGRRKL